MKKLTAAALAALMLLSAAGCAKDDKTIDTTTAATTVPETTETTVTTVTEVTTVETTAETTEITTEAEPDFSDFDINAPECLPYKLLGMTVEEIETEFGELIIFNMTHGVPHPMSKLYLNETDYYVLTFPATGSYTEMTNGKIELNRDALPIDVFIETDGIRCYPNVKNSSTSVEVSKIIPKWDFARIYPGGINCLTTGVYIDNYEFMVMWRTPDDIIEQLYEKLKEKTTEEKEMICQEYADEFMKNFNNYNAEITDIYVKTKGGTRNE